MTTTAAAAPAVRASTSSLSVLAWYEARRFARNPVFLAAATLTAYILWDRQRGMVADINTVTVYPDALKLRPSRAVLRCAGGKEARSHAERSGRNALAPGKRRRLSPRVSLIRTCDHWGVRAPRHE